MPSIRDILEVPSDSNASRAVFALLVVALTLFGFVMIYSASAPSAVSEGLSPTSYLVDQLKFAGIGIVAAAIVWRIPYRVWLGNVIYVIWAFGLVLVLLTAFAGAAKYGAQRWLVLGPISLQPSEFMKIALVLLAAKIMSDLRANVIDGKSALVQAGLLIIVPVGIIFGSQSDLGTTIIIGVGIISVMWLGEVPVRTILVILGVVIAFGVIATLGTAYRSNRLLFLNPWNDGENGYGNGYQIIHSYYAFSEGGIFGVGLGNSAEKYLYLPESETDFIYSIIGEELGMVGALAVIVAFLVLLRCGMTIARNADDDYGCMVSGALTIMIVFQAFLNMGSAVGVVPTTGKPLPFISSGGSSLIATFIMVGLILSIGEGAEGGRPLHAASRDVYEQRRDNLRVVRTVDADPFASGSGSRSSSSRSSSSRSGFDFEAFGGRGSSRSSSRNQDTYSRPQSGRTRRR